MKHFYIQETLQKLIVLPLLGFCVGIMRDWMYTIKKDIFENEYYEPFRHWFSKSYYEFTQNVYKIDFYFLKINFGLLKARFF